MSATTYRCFLTLFLIIAIAVPATATEQHLGQPEVLTDNSDAAEITIVLPRSAKLAPAFYDQLKAAAQDKLKSFREQAKKERAELKSSYPDDAAPAYVLMENYDANLVSDRIISLLEMSYAFTGGAHGNYSYESLNYDRAAKKEVAAKDLFDDLGSGSKTVSAFHDYVLADLKRQKKERLGDAYDEAEQEEQWLKDIDLPFDTLTFVPSSEAGKAGGIALQFAPYAVGPYAEGAYEVVVPQEVFREHLNSDWQARFAGKPETLTRVVNYQSRDGAFVLMKEPQPGATVSSPVTLQGEAPDYFFHEGEASLKVETDDGKAIATKYVTAEPDARPVGMAAGMVPFTGEIALPDGRTGDIQLVIGQNDPSDGEGGTPARVDFTVTAQ